MEKSKLAYLIVTHNGAAHIGKLLESLHTKEDVLVIDNASSDTTKEIVEKYGVKVIENSTNKGYAAAINQGLKILAEKYEYVFVLNQDIVLQSFNVETQNFASLQTYAIAQPLILLPDGRVNVDELVINVFGYVYPKNFGRKVDASLEKKETLFFSGAAFILNIEKYKKIGPFDESYFLYYEDVDYALWALLQGEKVLFDPGIVVIHDYKNSFVNAEKRALIKMNRKKLIRKYFLTTWQKSIFVSSSSVSVGNARSRPSLPNVLENDLTINQRKDIAKKLKPYLVLGFYTRQIPAWKRSCINLFLVPYSWLVKLFL
jgi:GT2 family glycosyltransferase